MKFSSFAIAAVAIAASSVNAFSTPKFAAGIRHQVRLTFVCFVFCQLNGI
jgi:hypothetical protein